MSLSITERMQTTVEQKKKVFFTITGTVRAKLQQQGTYKNMLHIDNLKDLFPDECFTFS